MKFHLRNFTQEIFVWHPKIPANLLSVFFSHFSPWLITKNLKDHIKTTNNSKENFISSQRCIHQSFIGSKVEEGQGNLRGGGVPAHKAQIRTIFFWKIILSAAQESKILHHSNTKTFRIFFHKIKRIIDNHPKDTYLNGQNTSIQLHIPYVRLPNDIHRSGIFIQCFFAKSVSIWHTWTASTTIPATWTVINTGCWSKMKCMKSESLKNGSIFQVDCHTALGGCSTTPQSQAPFVVKGGKPNVNKQNPFFRKESLGQMWGDHFFWRKNKCP